MKTVVIIGGGPGGLTAAYELTKFGKHPVVLEKEDKVGGLARTESYAGFHFDMGGHRFFTKVPEVSQIWHDVLKTDFLCRPRLSRIYYNGRFFHYPLRPFNALLNLGIGQSLLVLLSYLRWHIFPYPREDTFEQWVTNRFGKRLFETFFKTYTEKVWGVPCSELKAEWAAQRIKGLSLKRALFSMFLKPKTTIKTLIDQFEYPRRGPGMMWNAVKEIIEARGGEVKTAADVVSIRRTGRRIDSVIIVCNGSKETVHATQFISSMPITELVKRLDPAPPPEVVEAANKLTYRDFLTVCLIVNKPDTFPDQWIYVHDPLVKVCRIQNFKNWSPDMVPDPKKSGLGLEYFCNEGDSLWNMPDRDLVELGKKEIELLGLAACSDIEDGCVFRVPKAYPIYDSAYRGHLDILKAYADGLENLQTIGRNGLHRYNNQDHAMLTGILAARNVTLGENNDLWSVNTDQEYHEEIREEVAAEPELVLDVLQSALAEAFPRIDRLALGVSTGALAGIVLFLATLALVLKGGEVIGPNLELLGQYFPGYRVTIGGSLLGLAYGFALGFAAGWTFALLRNALVFLTMALYYRRAEWQLLRRFPEYI